MKYLMIIMIIFVFTMQYAHATVHPRPQYTYDIVKNNLTNQTMVNLAASYWSQYGFTLKYSNIHPSTTIEFHDYCMGNMVGEYNSLSHKIDIFTGCYKHADTFTQKIITHELGHFLGFEHYSDPPIMKPSVNEP